MQMRTKNTGVPDECRMVGEEEPERRYEVCSDHNQGRNGKMDREKEEFSFAGGSGCKPCARGSTPWGVKTVEAEGSDGSSREACETGGWQGLRCGMEEGMGDAGWRDVGWMQDRAAGRMWRRPEHCGACDRCWRRREGKAHGRGGFQDRAAGGFRPRAEHRGAELETLEQSGGWLRVWDGDRGKRGDGTWDG